MEVQSLAINALTKRIQEEAKVLPETWRNCAISFASMLYQQVYSTYSYRCISYTIVYSIHRAIEYM